MKLTIPDQLSTYAVLKGRSSRRRRQQNLHWALLRSSRGRRAPGARADPHHNPCQPGRRVEQHAALRKPLDPTAFLGRSAPPRRAGSPSGCLGWPIWSLVAPVTATGAPARVETTDDSQQQPHRPAGGRPFRNRACAGRPAARTACGGRTARAVGRPDGCVGPAAGRGDGAAGHGRAGGQPDRPGAGGGRRRRPTRDQRGHLRAQLRRPRAGRGVAAVGGPVGRQPGHPLQLPEQHHQLRQRLVLPEPRGGAEHRRLRGQGPGGRRAYGDDRADHRSGHQAGRPQRRAPVLVQRREVRPATRRRRLAPRLRQRDTPRRQLPDR